MTTVKRITAAFSIACIASQVLAQGNLTPPGAPSATMKTLEQIEPRTDLATVAGNTTYHHVISQPGSYYLSGNLAVTKTSGIQITADGVTLDLNGFEISRAFGIGGIGAGIVIPSTLDRATVHNGSIVGFSVGINSSATGCLFEKLSVSGCTYNGMLAGQSARIIDCRSHDNSGAGIYALHGSILNDCTAYNNTGTYGIYALSGSSLVGCSAYNNQVNYGIRASSSTLRGCTAYNNMGTGSSSYGIYASGSTVVECTALYNSNTNSPGASSQGIGIYAGNTGLVKDCTVSGNQGDGIQISGDCLVSGNTCDGNGNVGDGAGIHASSTDNRIENNNVTDNDRGIDVDLSGSFITRNSASGNTVNWEVAANNACLVVNRTGCTAISGNSGGTSPGSTDPNANYTY